MKAIITLEDVPPNKVNVKVEFDPPIAASDKATPAVADAFDCLAYLTGRAEKCSQVKVRRVR